MKSIKLCLIHVFGEAGLRRATSKRLLIALVAAHASGQAATLRASATNPATVPPTIRGTACRYHHSTSLDKDFGLMTLQAPGNGNQSGVILVINCSKRRITSLRDPSNSPMHMRKELYNPFVSAHFSHDSDGYDVFNFNEKKENTPFDHTWYSKRQGWRGPCKYRDPELDTENFQSPAEKRTTIIDINVCKTQAIVMMAPISGQK
jgi:hypothetical protein